MDFDIFIGRFHPIMVHLPIGFIVLAIILEMVGLSLKRRKHLFKKAVLSSLVASIVGSLFSVATGLLLANESDYDAVSLNQHKWLGISVLVLSVVAYLLKRYLKAYHWKKSVMASMVLFTLISVTGHLGGELTHGKDYLVQYAPNFVKRMVGLKTMNTVSLEGLHADSLQIYPHIIRPIFEQTCIACHNASKGAGKLDLASYNHLFEEAENGVPIVQENISESELFRRISLPTSSKKFMPPKGKALSYTQLLVFKYWIKDGADSLAKFNSEKMSPELIELMLRDYNLDYNPRPYYDRVVVNKVEESTLELLSSNGFVVKYLGENNFLLDVKFVDKSISKEQVNLLKKVSDHITFLKLFNCELSDTDISILSEFKHLTRLDLHSNNISDSVINHLKGLNNLEVLNLYDTQISDVGLQEALKMSSLKRVYVWKTKVTQKFIEEAKKENEQIEINAGILKLKTY